MRRQNTRFSVLTEDAMRPHRRLSDVSNVSNVSIVTRHSYISQGTRHSNVSRNTHGLTQDELREAARQDRGERAQRGWERDSRYSRCGSSRDSSCSTRAVKGMRRSLLA